jgi:hypothetical protein
MRFIYADSLDFVDPNYDFLADRSSPGREAYWDDLFPHEILGYAPYNGLLVSRAIVGGNGRVSGKYTASQAGYFTLVGAREFLRFPEQKFPGSWVFGDCGAFSYHQMPEPPYSAEEMADFYANCQFTHGCSVDHIIFDYDDSAKGLSSGKPDARRRLEITLENARQFLESARRHDNRFTPVGVIQGWSPDTMGIAAEKLQAMGYTYVAAGGMAPLKSSQIHACLQAIRERIRPDVDLHVLGFAKADDIHEFARHNITSFDSTSPLVRAFKDAKSNYYLPGNHGRLRYYCAIRIPQALENNSLKRLVRAGRVKQETVIELERTALSKVRDYDRNKATRNETLDALLTYAELLLMAPHPDASPVYEGDLLKLRQQYGKTLEERPWKECACAICSAISVEVAIFRSSNRNKRRGIHNLGVYCKHIRSKEGLIYREPQAALFSY